MRCILTFLTVAAVSPAILAGQQATVAVIGTGDMGGSLGPKLAEAGYTVVYGSREPARADVRELVASTAHGASAASQEEATAQAEIVILAVHWEVIEEVLSNLGDVTGKVLVDISDPNRVRVGSKASSSYFFEAASGPVSGMSRNSSESHPTSKIWLSYPCPHPPDRASSGPDSEHGSVPGRDLARRGGGVLPSALLRRR